MFNLFSKSEDQIVARPQSSKFELMNGGIQSIDDPKHCYHSGVYDWFSYDDRATYESNIKKQSSDWQWRHRPVKYTVNSQHYRCPEWDQINWNNSVLLLGCSMVFGLGLNDDETLGAILERKLGVTVINLGVSGASAMFQWMNTTKLIEQRVNPIRVIYIWPHHFRVSEIYGPIEHRTCGRWNFKTHDLSKAWSDRDHHSLEYVKLCIDSTTQQWKCPTNHYTFCLDTNTYLPQMHRFSFNDYIDYSRDTSHPGPKTIEMWADKITNDIKSENK